MNLGDDDDDDNESVFSSVSTTSNSSRKNYPAILILTSCYDFDVAHLNEKANQVTCKGCGQKMKYNLSSKTSNLVNHIKDNESKKSMHAAILQDYISSTSTNIMPNSKRKIYHDETPRSNKQPKIESFSSPAKLNFIAKSRIDKMLVELVVNSSLPLSLLDSKELKDFCSAIDNRYQVPTSKTFKKTYIPETYEIISNVIKLKLSKIDSINISCDLWSDPIMRSFIAFMSHFIDDDWNLVNCVIGCVRMYGSHSFDNIFSKFDSFLEQYKISKKIYKVITYNGSNIKKAFKDFSVLNEAYESFDEESSDESDNLTFMQR